MNLYFLGILAALVVFFAVGIAAGRMVKDTNDYYVSGRNAPTLLIVGSLIASFLSTGAFLGDTGEVYSGFFIGIVTVGVIQQPGGETKTGQFVIDHPKSSDNKGGCHKSTYRTKVLY